VTVSAQYPSARFQLARPFQRDFSHDCILGIALHAQRPERVQEDMRGLAGFGRQFCFMRRKPFLVCARGPF
jgi:hypothetical protein